MAEEIRWPFDGGASLPEPTFGEPLGLLLGLPLGLVLGLPLGEDVGLPVGLPLGDEVGLPLGLPLGEDVGLPLGLVVGLPVGLTDASTGTSRAAAAPTAESPQALAAAAGMATAAITPRTMLIWVVVFMGASPSRLALAR